MNEPLSNEVIEGIEERYEQRVRHLYSHLHSPDEELSWGQTLHREADQIAVESDGTHATVTVYTPAAVYHFGAFKTHYVGHATRKLVDLLAHFGLHLDAEWIAAHRSFVAYLLGDRITVGETEYPIARRAEGFVLVEPVQWQVATRALDQLAELAQRYDMPPEHVVEMAVQLVAEGLDGLPVETGGAQADGEREATSAEPVMEGQDDTDGASNRIESKEETPAT
ncbi:MAG: hypothetical protein ACYCYO_03790 [Bacilli bacterium]